MKNQLRLTGMITAVPADRDATAVFVTAAAIGTPADRIGAG